MHISYIFSTVVPNGRLLRSWDGEFVGAVDFGGVFNGGGIFSEYF